MFNFCGSGLFFLYSSSSPFHPVGDGGVERFTEFRRISGKRFCREYGARALGQLSARQGKNFPLSQVCNNM